MERVSVHIDGANFYLLALKKLGIREADFDFEKFAAALVNGRTVGPYSKRYYVGTVLERPGDPKSKAAMSRQTSLFTRLRTDHWEIRTSRHRKRTEEVMVDDRVQDWKRLQGLGVTRFTFEKYREKGIDVKIATDLIVGAVDDQYDAAIVVSSDTDLIPAFDWIRGRYEKRIEYVGFSIPDPTDPHKSIKPTIGMIKRTDVQRILLENDLRGMMLNTNPAGLI